MILSAELKSSKEELQKNQEELQKRIEHRFTGWLPLMWVFYYSLPSQSWMITFVILRS